MLYCHIAVTKKCKAAVTYNIYLKVLADLLHHL